MNNQVRFTCTALQGTNKQGVLQKDKDGYYTMPIGGLDVFNSAGEFYTYQGAKELFESSSSFMRRVQAGCLFGELGHPKMLPGQSMEAYAHRIMTIEETRVAAHFADIWLDFDSVKDKQGRSVIAIMAKVAPAGPYAASTEASFQNPKQDTCFSIRAFTEDSFVGGVKHRALKRIETFDFVTEPGIQFARKYHAPSLEALADITMKREDFAPLLKRTEGVGMESVRNGAGELFQAMGWSQSGPSPAWVKW